MFTGLIVAAAVRGVQEAAQRADKGGKRRALFRSVLDQGLICSDTCGAYSSIGTLCALQQAYERVCKP
jgi:hypothetical protein